MLTPTPDYALLDQTRAAFSMFAPRQFWRELPEGAADIAIPVAEGVAVSARFYQHDAAAPTILFFHGNGEVAVEYDSLAPLYRDAGVNLLVTDYRGYGASGGLPSFAAMLADAHTILRAVRGGLASQGYRGRLFVMGRSLGAHPAAELAAHAPDALAGLIVESGAAGIGRMVQALADAGHGAAAAELARQHEAKLRSIRIPALLLHGEADGVVPLASAQALYGLLELSEKRLVVIPQATHNSIILAGKAQYFGAIREFVQAHG